MHTVIMLIAIGGMLIVSVICFIYKQNGKGILVLFSAIWAILLVSLLKFWPLTIVGVGGFVALAIAVFRFLKVKRVYLGHHLILGVLIIIGLIVIKIPNDERYYLFNIRFIKHIEADY